jgi:hypothetical protein
MPAQDTSACGVGNRDISRPISAISPAAVAGADAGDLRQPVHGGQHGGVRPGPGARAGDAAGVGAPGGRDRGEVAADLLFQSGDLGIQHLDHPQVRAGAEHVLRAELHAGERRDQRGVLVFHGPRA